MTDGPFSDDGDLYDALGPQPAHQDYRRSSPPPIHPPTSNPTPWHEKLAVGVLLAVLAVIFIALVATGSLFQGSDSGSTPSAPTRPTPTARCEQAWLDNRNNSYNMARSKAEYMTNCVEVQKALDQIKKDHQ